ncbi:hypothetical protein [Kitasatospora sp. NPDC059160]|uniref:hypothetical protein n=1 Tax=Kitasatospora sp. NPDC059160 TaxID=3346748 RepID=UPI0036B3A3C3
MPRPSSTPSHRPAPQGAVGNWQDARRAAPADVEAAAAQERRTFVLAQLRMGGAWQPAVVTAWRPLPQGRWAARVTWGLPITTEWVAYAPRVLRPVPLATRPDDRDGDR